MCRATHGIANRRTCLCAQYITVDSSALTLLPGHEELMTLVIGGSGLAPGLSVGHLICVCFWGWSSLSLVRRQT